MVPDNSNSNMIINILLILNLMIYSVCCSFSIITDLANLKKDLFSSLLPSRSNPIKEEILVIPTRPATFSAGVGHGLLTQPQQPVLLQESVEYPTELSSPISPPQEFNQPLVQLSGYQGASEPTFPPEEFNKPFLFPDDLDTVKTLYRENVLLKRFHNKKQKKL